MKRALIVSPYFLPCNLAGVHRPRLLAQGLAEFGWEPVVLTVHPQYYGELAEPGLSRLIPDSLRIERVDAVRPALSSELGIGDLSLRAFRPMRRRMRQLLSRKEVDLVFVSVLPGYAGLLGSWAKQKFGVSFVLDYQDPWVSDWGAGQPGFSKAGVAHWLATVIEPRFAPWADAVTAVSNATLDSLRKRGLLSPETPTAELPIGSDPHDHDVAREVGKSRLEKKPGTFHIAFLGTVPEKTLPVVRAVFEALRTSDLKTRVELFFGGTSGRVDGDDSMGLGALALQCGLDTCVRIEPRRFGYLDALRTMQEADALLMLGSTEKHYTASKLFPYWLAGRPIFGLAQTESTVWQIARELGGVRLFEYSSESDLEQPTRNLLAALSDFMAGQASAIPPRNPEAFEPYSARGIAGAYAGIFDRAWRSRNEREG
jgi:hypothetical protein